MTWAQLTELQNKRIIRHRIAYLLAPELPEGKEAAYC
jgi:hypothetical protein